jgi:DNA (cytosine-5)-methyltransferase 1
LNNTPKYLNLFAGAGGLSEGFNQVGYTPIAHVEVDSAACNTLKTRAAYHWLNSQGRVQEYYNYLEGNINRTQLYSRIPEYKIMSVINKEIGESTLSDLFRKIDELLNGQHLDIIIGGPPCQSYSLVGRSRDSNRMRGDQRNHLYIYYAEFLKKYRPLYFVFENVVGLLSAKNKSGQLYFDNMRQTFNEIGYETEYRVLTSYKYGVLQNRRRIILVGKRGVTSDFYPEIEEWEPEVMIGELLHDLPFIKAGEGAARPCHFKNSQSHYLHDAGITDENKAVTWHWARHHSERDLEIYHIAVKQWNENRKRLDYNALPERLKTHKNRDSFLDRFKVVAANLPYSQTIVAHISQDGHYYIHPDITQNRSLTPREAARLQTFPDDYYFESVSENPGYTAAFHQIGNAVPVLLARKIAGSLLRSW